jgi:pimeloyl-ACP methyl ester carboxylesterase
MIARLVASLVVCLVFTLVSMAPGPGVALAQEQNVTVACGGQGTPPASPAAEPAEATPGAGGGSERVELETGEALLWPAGDRGVLLLHGAAYDAASWEPQASVLAGEGYTVLALETLSPEAVLEGIAFLTGECGVEGVTIVGASAGGGAALGALADDPAGVAGLILLGATGEVETLGDYPKLFTASEGEGLADQLEVMADNAPGEGNETLILPGSTHAQAIFETDQGDVLIEAMLAFLDETES